jgi:hypothetical protein
MLDFGCEGSFSEILAFVFLAEGRSLSLRHVKHHVNILEMNDDSYRVSQSRARKARAAA